MQWWPIRIRSVLRVVHAVTYVLAFGGMSAAAQDNATFRLLVTRPDAQLEDLTGWRLDEAPTPPGNDASRQSCGSASIWLRKLQYSETAGFTYYYVLRRSPTSPWEEWRVPRPDRGQFTPQRVEGVKVTMTSGAEPACQDFHLPLYCLANCAKNPWWQLDKDEPKTLTVYLSAGGYWDLLFTRVVSVPARITEPGLSILNTSTESWNIQLTPSAQKEGRLGLIITPQWRALHRLLWPQQELKALLTYRSEASDHINEGIVTTEERTFPIILKPDPWLLPVPLLVGLVLALLVRRLFWNDVKRPLREFALVSVAGIILLTAAYWAGTSVEVANIKADAGALSGAGLLGFTTGLSGRTAVLKRVRHLFGLPEAE